MRTINDPQAAHAFIHEARGRIDVFTATQYAMLVAANGCSLPGDGLRIKGSGQHRVARTLEAMGFVRVAAPPDAKARVHITEAGRKRREQIAAGLLGGS